MSNKKIIPKSTLTVNENISSGVLGNEIVVPTKEEIRKPADIFMNRPEYALSHGLVKSSVIYPEYYGMDFLSN